MALMLLVDLKDSDEKLAQFVTDQCSQYGKVLSVKINRNPNSFAMVVMADRMQTYRIAEAFGGSTVGTSALVNLEQKR
jgi:hypothetical protein